MVVFEIRGLCNACESVIWALRHLRFMTLTPRRCLHKSSCDPTAPARRRFISSHRLVSTSPTQPRALPDEQFSFWPLCAAGLMVFSPFIGLPSHHGACGDWCWPLTRTENTILATCSRGTSEAKSNQPTMVVRLVTLIINNPMWSDVGYPGVWLGIKLILQRRSILVIRQHLN